MSFAERQRHLLQTGEFSDFVMTVDGRDFAIHRNIVCPQSTVLHRLITGNFKVSSFHVTATIILTIHRKDVKVAGHLPKPTQIFSRKS